MGQSETKREINGIIYNEPQKALVNKEIHFSGTTLATFLFPTRNYKLFIWKLHFIGNTNFSFGDIGKFSF